jgi:hypothetical protein
MIHSKIQTAVSTESEPLASKPDHNNNPFSIFSSIRTRLESSVSNCGRTRPQSVQFLKSWVTSSQTTIEKALIIFHMDQGICDVEVPDLAST